MSLLNAALLGPLLDRLSVALGSVSLRAFAEVLRLDWLRRGSLDVG